MMTMTFDVYDALVEKMQTLETPTLWPTSKQIEMMEEEPEKWISFLIYLSEKGEEPKNKEEEYGKKNVNQFLRDHLLLVDKEEIS